MPVTTIIAAVVRHLLTTFGGSLLATGYLTADDVTTLSGAIAGLGGVAWSLYEKRK